MRDPLTWSLPLLRVSGITVRVHVLFPLVALGLIFRMHYLEPKPDASGVLAPGGVVPGTWIDMAVLMGLLFGVVLLHEFGHCFGARLVEGEASEVLIWPLGGLAYVEVPNTPRANFIATAAGPAVNLLICAVTGLLFLAVTQFQLRLPWNPFAAPTRVHTDGDIRLFLWSGTEVWTNQVGVLLLARTFWLSWVLFLLNLIPGYPLDGGRMFQCALWPRSGYHRATLAAVFTGFFSALVLVLFSFGFNEVMVFALALFIYVSCRNEWIRLETGGEEGVFGYDFSQGYTSLERDQPAPPRQRRPNFLQRWLQRRAARRQQREQELREAEERRMDELLEKIQRNGMAALTEEEKRFLIRVSQARNRNRQ